MIPKNVLVSVHFMARREAVLIFASDRKEEISMI
jgi:hypothetical protein